MESKILHHRLRHNKKLLLILTLTLTGKLLLVTVTDPPLVLQVPRVLKVLREQRVQLVLRVLSDPVVPLDILVLWAIPAPKETPVFKD